MKGCALHEFQFSHKQKMRVICVREFLQSILFPSVVTLVTQRQLWHACAPVSLSIPISLSPAALTFSHTRSFSQFFQTKEAGSFFLRLILNCLPRIHQWKKKGEKIKAVI